MPSILKAYKSLYEDGSAGILSIHFIWFLGCQKIVFASTIRVKGPICQLDFGVKLKPAKRNALQNSVAANVKDLCFRMCNSLFILVADYTSH